MVQAHTRTRSTICHVVLLSSVTTRRSTSYVATTWSTSSCSLRTARAVAAARLASTTTGLPDRKRGVRRFRQLGCVMLMAGLSCRSAASSA